MRDKTVLGGLIREGRASAKRYRGPGWTLDHVARQAGLRRPALVAIERGDRLPSLPALARLHALLPRPDGGVRTTADLAQWLARWARAQAERSAEVEGDAARIDDEQLRAELQAAASLIDEAVTPPPAAGPAGGPLRSLTEFPARLRGAVALLGDRRERPPESRGDLFVEAASVSDVCFVPLLHSGALAAVRSDKVVAVAVGDPVELCGVDLLVLAGPNVNWAARPVNAGALFRYDVAATWEHWEAEYRAEADLGSPRVLAAFAALLTTMDRQTAQLSIDAAADQLSPAESAELGRAHELASRLLAPREGPGRLHTPEEVVARFQARGHADPVNQTVHAEPESGRVDHAVVSLAPNPFDRERLAVLVGGSHGRGTAQALRYLVEHPEEFRDRPFGGVLEVRVGDYVDWSSSYQQPATLRWLTDAYTPAELQARFAEALDPEARRANPALADRSDNDIRAALAFIDRLCEPDARDG